MSLISTKKTGVRKQLQKLNRPGTAKKKTSQQKYSALGMIYFKKTLEYCLIMSSKDNKLFLFHFLGF